MVGRSLRITGGGPVARADQSGPFAAHHWRGPSGPRRPEWVVRYASLARAQWPAQTMAGRSLRVTGGGPVGRVLVGGVGRIGVVKVRGGLADLGEMAGVPDPEPRSCLARYD
jgi:hypothetical protein